MFRLNHASAFYTSNNIVNNEFKTNRQQEIQPEIDIALLLRHML